jgi:hypothetical protein
MKRIFGSLVVLLFLALLVPVAFSQTPLAPPLPLIAYPTEVPLSVPTTPHGAIPATDTVPPAVSMDGFNIVLVGDPATSMVKKLMLSPQVSDNVCVALVEIYIQGAGMTSPMLAGWQTVAPFLFSADTALIPPGTYTFTVKAYDGRGNTASASAAWTK